MPRIISKTYSAVITPNFQGIFSFEALVNGLEEKSSFKLRAALKVSNFAGMTPGGYARSFDSICKWLEDKFQIKSVEEEFE